MAEEILNSSDRIKEEVLRISAEGIQGLSGITLPTQGGIRGESDHQSDRFPEPEDLLDKRDLRLNFYDLTWENFKNRAFLDELAKKEVFSKGGLDQIVSMRDAFEVKR